MKFHTPLTLLLDQPWDEFLLYNSTSARKLLLHRWIHHSTQSRLSFQCVTNRQRGDKLLLPAMSGHCSSLSVSSESRPFKKEGERHLCFLRSSFFLFPSDSVESVFFPSHFKIKVSVAVVRFRGKLQYIQAKSCCLCHKLVDEVVRQTLETQVEMRRWWFDGDNPERTQHVTQSRCRHKFGREEKIRVMARRPSKQKAL